MSLRTLWILGPGWCATASAGTTGSLRLFDRAASVPEPAPMADFPWILYFGILAFLAVAVAGVRAWWRWRSEASPSDLAFDSFADELGLDRRSRWIVRRLSDRAGMATPAVLLLSHDTLARVARSHGPKSGPDRERLADLLVLVRERRAAGGASSSTPSVVRGRGLAVRSAR